MNFMGCIPTSVIPDHMKLQGCLNLPRAANATSAEGPEWDIAPKQEQVARASQCLQQSAFNVAAILTLFFAYTRL